MEYRYSIFVNPLTYQTEGLSGEISLRVFNDQKSEDYGVIKAQEDWRKHVGPINGLKKGSLGPQWNFLSVAFPEIIPERMVILAYFNEFIFLHDDVVESVNKTQGDQQNDEAQDACQDGCCSNGTANTRQKTGRKWMIDKTAQTMLTIDRGPAVTALKLWTEWFTKGAGRENHTRFETLDEYLEYRILDVGKMYLTGVAIFAMGLSIPEHETDLRSQLCYPAWAALGLTNDLWSFDKERHAAAAAGDTHVCNALWVLMHQSHNQMAEEAAIQVCRLKIKEYVAEYEDNVRETLQRADVSRDLRIFVEAVQYIISGNLQWTKGAPRYNPELMYNARQLNWMMHGTPASL